MARTPSRQFALRTLAASIALAASGAVYAGTVVVFSQPEVGADGSFLYTSQNDINVGGFGNFATVYDDFTLANGATVTDVHWSGGFFAGSEPGGGIPGFDVSFYSDAGGAPGALLVDYSIGGNANQTNHHACGNILDCFNYSVDLPAGSPFVAAPGTRYWLSVVADVGFPPAWGWEQGSGGNQHGFQASSGTLTDLGVDFAFELTAAGTAGAPEPATVALLGAGLAGLGFGRRRKRT